MISIFKCEVTTYKNMNSRSWSEFSVLCDALPSLDHCKRKIASNLMYKEFDVVCVHLKYVNK